MKTSTLFTNTTLLAFIFASIMTIGCDRSWHSLMSWKAEEFFDDPKVISLCKAIEANDLMEIDRLVADGADVNAKGKGNMTPLLWAFPEDKPEVFKRLLEHGADPNVEVTSDFNTRMQFILPGDSVLHLAAKTSKPNYFKYVMQHGGNPNLVSGNGMFRHPPLVTVIRGLCPDQKEAIQLLIDAGADLEYVGVSERPPLYYAASGDYNLTLQLLQAGASFNCFFGHDDTFLHLVLRQHKRLMNDTTLPQEHRLERGKQYEKIFEWLEANGADLEGARRDNAIKGRLSPGRIAELKKRYADELAAKQAAKEQKEQQEQQQEKENDALP